MTVWIAQCLCPQRHCIMAAVGEASDADAAEKEIAQALRKRVEDWLAKHIIDPWCSICGSQKWHVELGRTAFKNLAEAEPAIRDTEIENAAANLLLGNLHRHQRPN